VVVEAADVLIGILDSTGKVKYVGGMTKVDEDNLCGADVTERSEGSNATQRSSRAALRTRILLGSTKGGLGTECACESGTKRRSKVSLSVSLLMGSMTMFSRLMSRWAKPCLFKNPMARSSCEVSADLG
jgi:hypothetical protein